jgi:hypothetical protein
VKALWTALRIVAGVVGAVLAVWGLALFAGGDASDVPAAVYYGLAAVLVAVGAGLIVAAVVGGPRRHG